MNKNIKGVTLIELMIVFALIGIVTPLIFSLLMYGVENFNSDTKYIDQQDKVSRAIAQIRKDFEESSSVQINRDNGIDVSDIVFCFPPTPLPTNLATPLPLVSPSITPLYDNLEKHWKFESYTMSPSGRTVNALRLKVGSGTFGDVIEDLDLSLEGSKFSYNTTDGKLVLYIKPNNTNTYKYRRNIDKPIITEFSVRYKPTASPRPTPTPT